MPGSIWEREKLHSHPDPHLLPLIVLAAGQWKTRMKSADLAVKLSFLSESRSSACALHALEGEPADDAFWQTGATRSAYFAGIEMAGRYGFS
ncbi:MAG: hypothetical protein ACLT76_11870 [Clostridium fessum]